jgi:NAD(P)-dependent dehydrogenase (short-subunit alcohol dehydrogenase family)
MDSSGKGAVVFGGASGLGEATVARLRADGAEVVVADIAEGADVRCDVTDADQVQEALDAADDLRVVVVCAGLGTPAKLVARDGSATPFDDFARVVNVNLLGTINVLRLAASAMAHNEPDEHGARGVIVCTASIAAYDGQIGQIAYAASKGGVVGVTLPAARELARYGVRVMTIAPGLFETPMLKGLPPAAFEALGQIVPFPSRLGQPSEYADLVRFIVDTPMLNGEVIRLDGAVRLPPK